MSRGLSLYGGTSTECLDPGPSCGSRTMHGHPWPSAVQARPYKQTSSGPPQKPLSLTLANMRAAHKFRASYLSLAKFALSLSRPRRWRSEPTIVPSPPQVPIERNPPSDAPSSQVSPISYLHTFILTRFAAIPTNPRHTSAFSSTDRNNRARIRDHTQRTTRTQHQSSRLRLSLIFFPSPPSTRRRTLRPLQGPLRI